MLESNVLVAGGGAVETALSIYLESFATTLGSREQLAIADFAEALLVIPKTLAVNAAQVMFRGDTRVDFVFCLQLLLLRSLPVVFCDWPSFGTVVVDPHRFLVEFVSAAVAVAAAPFGSVSRLGPALSKGLLSTPTPHCMLILIPRSFDKMVDSPH